MPRGGTCWALTGRRVEDHCGWQCCTPLGGEARVLWEPIKASWHKPKFIEGVAGDDGMKPINEVVGNSGSIEVVAGADCFAITEGSAQCWFFGHNEEHGKDILEILEHVDMDIVVEPVCFTEKAPFTCVG